MPADPGPPGTSPSVTGDLAAALRRSIGNTEDESTGSPQPPPSISLNGPTPPASEPATGSSPSTVEIPEELKELLKPLDTKDREGFSRMYQELVAEEITPSELLWHIKLFDFRYAQLRPDANLLFTNLRSTATKLVKRYMLGQKGNKPRITNPLDPFLVEMLCTIHPTVPMTTIKTALKAAHRKEILT